MTHVPYRGSPQAMLGLLANEIQLFPVGMALGAAHLEEGKLTALTVTAERRMPMLPGVPTVGEVGLADLTISNWWGIAAPKGTPEPVIELLHQIAVESLHDPIVVERFMALGMTVLIQTRDQFTTSLRQFRRPDGSRYAVNDASEYAELCLDRWESLIAASKIKLVLTGQAYWG